jgi:hypothetical protein
MGRTMPDKNTSSIDGETREFLNIEEVANSLASRLKRLDDEAKCYESAAGKLDTAAGATRDLTKVLKEIGEEVTKAIEVVASVGGPEIVKRLKSLDAQEKERSEVLLKKVGLAVNLAGLAVVLALAAVVVPFLR